MSNIQWKKLLSGTDVRGTAIAAEGKKANLTEEVAAGIGFIFVNWLAANLDRENEEIEVAVGHDSRLSADRLKKALAQGIKLAGAEVYSAGLASTPAMFMSTILEEHQYDLSLIHI